MTLKEYLSKQVVRPASSTTICSEIYETCHNQFSKKTVVAELQAITEEFENTKAIEISNVLRESYEWW